MSTHSKRGRPSNGLIAPCRTCGKDVSFVPSKPQYFCSRQCLYENRRTKYSVDGGRVCKVCIEIKPLDQFKIAPGSGYYRTCIACMALHDRAKKWSRRTNGTIEEWLYRLSIVSEDGVLSTAQEKKDLRRARKLREMSRNRERPWIKAAQRHRMRALSLGCCVDESVTAEALMELFNTRDCFYCGRELDEVNRQIDHMIPLISGGIHSLLNIVMACAYCNQWKGDHDFGWWMLRVKEPYRSIAHEHFVSCQRRLMENVKSVGESQERSMPKNNFGSLCG